MNLSVDCNNLFYLPWLQGSKHSVKKDCLWLQQVTKKGLDLASGFEQIPEPV